MARARKAAPCPEQSGSMQSKAHAYSTSYITDVCNPFIAWIILMYCIRWSWCGSWYLMDGYLIQNTKINGCKAWHLILMFARLIKILLYCKVDLQKRMTCVQDGDGTPRVQRQRVVRSKVKVVVGWGTQMRKRQEWKGVSSWSWRRTGGSRSSQTQGARPKGIDWPYS